MSALNNDINTLEIKHIWRSDPVNVESQAAYLKRLGLLTKAEEKLLTVDAYDKPTIVIKVLVQRGGVNAEPYEAEDYQDV